MKKILLCIALMLFGLQMTEARAQNVVEKGSSILNVGVGVLDDKFPISVSYDYGLIGQLFDAKSAITIGGMATTVFGNNYTGVFAGPRVGFHYHFIPQLDLYATTMIGYGMHTVYNNADGTKHYKGKTWWGTHGGVRYLFTPSIGVYAELGYGYSFANIGIAFKF